MVPAARVISRCAGNDARAKRTGSTVKYGTIIQMNREPFGGTAEDAAQLMRDEARACRARFGRAFVRLEVNDDESRRWEITLARSRQSALWTSIVWVPNATEMRGGLELFEGREAQ